MQIETSVQSCVCVCVFVASLCVFTCVRVLCVYVFTQQCAVCVQSIGSYVCIASHAFKVEVKSDRIKITHMHIHRASGAERAGEGGGCLCCRRHTDSLLCENVPHTDRICIWTCVCVRVCARAPMHFRWSSDELVPKSPINSASSNRTQHTPYSIQYLI